MLSPSQCVHLYYCGPDFRFALEDLRTPARMALLYRRMRAKNPDVLRAYSLAFYDETTTHLRIVGACHADWDAMVDSPNPLPGPDPMVGEEALVDAAAIVLRVTQNSFCATWPRGSSGVSCLLVKKTDWLRASTQLGRAPGVSTGRFCAR